MTCDQAWIPPSGGGLIYWFDSRVRTRVRVLALTEGAVLSCAWFVDLDTVG